MFNLKKIFFGISASILLLLLTFLLIILIVEKRTNKALNDYSMLPDQQKVVDKAVLGRGSKNILTRLRYGFKRGALELVCTDQGNILLLMKDDVRNITIYKGATLFTSFRIENGVHKGSADIEEMNFVDSQYFDTMLSRPLSEKETTAIIQALKERQNSNGISLGLDDGGYGFVDYANISDVTRLIDRCKSIH